MFRCASLALCLITPTAAHAAQVISDGSDGVFHPLASMVIDLPADGVLNYTTIDIPAGVRVIFRRNAANTPVFMAATGDVNIAGSIDVSATATDLVIPAPVPNNPKQGGGPGAGNGGAGGGSGPGTPGSGLAGGAGGDGGQANSLGHGGGGGGMAEPGLEATRYSGFPPGAGGAAVARPDLLPGVSGGGGSGGGGGGAGERYGFAAGGFGGGGGGALNISTPGSLSLTGTLLANGAHGGWAFANVFVNGGPGGGGSGGNLELWADSLVLADTALVQALGGYGGGKSTQPYSSDPQAFSDGADGGLGYLALNAAHIDIAPGAVIDAQLQAVPLPASLPLLGGALLVIVRRSRAVMG